MDKRGVCCPQAVFREAFSRAFRKPANRTAQNVFDTVSVHRGSCCWSRIEQRWDTDMGFSNRILINAL